METPNIAPPSNVLGLVRIAKYSMPAGLLCLVGGGVALAADVRALGIALIVVGVLCPCVGFALMLVVGKRTRAWSRDMQARAQAAEGDLERAVRDYQQRHQNDS
jgi:hypothetical protein